MLNAKLVRKFLALSIVFVVGCNVALMIMNAKEDPSSAIKTTAQLPKIMDIAKKNLRHQEIPDHDQEDGMERIAQSNSRTEIDDGSFWLQTKAGIQRRERRGTKNPLRREPQ